MSAAQNRADREHLARVRDAAPKLLEACVLGAQTLAWVYSLAPSAPLGRAFNVLRDAIAATQPPAKRKEAKP